MGAWRTAAGLGIAGISEFLADDGAHLETYRPRIFVNDLNPAWVAAQGGVWCILFAVCHGSHSSGNDSTATGRSGAKGTRLLPHVVPVGIEQHHHRVKQRQVCGQVLPDGWRAGRRARQHRDLAQEVGTQRADEVVGLSKLR